MDSNRIMFCLDSRSIRVRLAARLCEPGARIPIEVLIEQMVVEVVVEMVEVALLPAFRAGQTTYQLLEFIRCCYYRV